MRLATDRPRRTVPGQSAPGALVGKAWKENA